MLRRAWRTLVGMAFLVAGLWLVAVGWAFLTERSDAEVSRLIAGGSIVAAIATGILALATFVAVDEAGRQAAISQEALAVTREAVAAANREADASIRQAEMSGRAVEAAEAATRAARTANAINSTPFLTIGRPNLVLLAEDPHIRTAESTRIFVSLRNIGPGVALDVQMRLEVQYRPQEPWQPSMYGVWGESVLLESAGTVLASDAADLVNMGIPSDQLIGPNGQPLDTMPGNVLVPRAIRVVVSWLSTGGARSELRYVWITEDINDTHPQSWAFESLTIDPRTGDAALGLTPGRRP